jgi:hypothetical protein
VHSSLYLRKQRNFSNGMNLYLFNLRKQINFMSEPTHCLFVKKKAS